MYLTFLYLLVKYFPRILNETFDIKVLDEGHHSLMIEG